MLLSGCPYAVTIMPPDLPLPLDGIRVCDFSWIVAGPQATRILADLGADVVKVENESHLDSMRIGLQQDMDRPSLNRSGFHSNFSRNKRAITANLYHPKGREAVERLLAVSDVVIENYSAGAFARMGFPWGRLQEINPSLIYVSVSGFGHVGRDRHLWHLGPQRPGHLWGHRHVRASRTSPPPAGASPTSTTAPATTPPSLS